MFSQTTRLPNVTTGVCPNGSSQYVAGQLDQAVPYLSSAQSVPTVTNTVTLLPSTHKSSCSVPFLSPVSTHSYQHCHTATLHTQIKLFRTFPQPSQYPQLPTLSHCCPPHTKLTPNAQLHCQQSTLPPNTFNRRTSGQRLVPLTADTPVSQQ